MSKKGFTLVEMLIVVTIIGILAAALVPRLTGAQERARDSARSADLNQIGAAMGMYNTDNGAYPGTGGALTEYYENTLVPRYMDEIPEDPQAERTIHDNLFGDRDDDDDGDYSYDEDDNGGEYAYYQINNRGAQGAGGVVAANTEAEGGTANWITDDDEFLDDFDDLATVPNEDENGVSESGKINEDTGASDLSSVLCDEVLVDTAEGNAEHESGGECTAPSVPEKYLLNVMN